LIPYWVLFITAALGAVTSGGGTIGRRGIPPVFIFFCVATAFFVGLRYKVGADWTTYVDLFDFAAHASFGRAMGTGDYGYQVLSWIAGQQGMEIWAVNLACAALFTWGLMRFCLVQPNPWVAMAIAVPYIVIVVAMGYTRQATALGFVMAGLADYIKRENLLRFAGYVLVGALFHSTAVMAFVLIGMTNRNSRFLNALIGLAFAFFFYRTFISTSINRLDYIYIQRGYGSQGALVRVLLDVVAALAFYAFGSRLGFSETEKKIWRNFSLASFGAMVALGVVSSSTAVDRAAIYLMPLQIAVFTRIAIMSGMSSVITVLAAFAMVQFSWLTFAQHAKFWIPYQAYGFK